jgi:hypothetical protein
MIYKHNKGRTWKYRALAMASGYQIKVRGFNVPAPLYTPLPYGNLPSGAPDDDLIGAISPDRRDDDDALGELVLA